MGDRRGALDQKESTFSYFEVQAFMGTTKHMGGLETTLDLIRGCHIDRGTRVLDVGCGAGATACYLSREVGCRVVGVDLRRSMVDLSVQRAQQERVADRVAFQVADARRLPFQDASFDVLLCESVVTFIEDKRQVVEELARVTRVGGYVGLTEEVWLKPPPEGMAEHVQRTWEIGADLLTADGWCALLQEVGLREVVVEPHAVDPRRESTQLKRYRAKDMLRMFYRALSLYVGSASFRRYVQKQMRLPKDTFTYLGYVVAVGARPDLGQEGDAR